MATTLNAGTAIGGAAISADTTGILQLQSGSTPTTAVTIDTSQNVGIGASPTQKLDVYGSDNNNLIISRNSNNTSSLRFQSNAAAGYIVSAGAIPLIMDVNGAERMRLDSAGSLLLGSTAQAASGASKLLVKSSNPSTGYCADFLQSSANGGTYYFQSFWVGAGTQVGYISSNGSTTTYATSSDYRLKENIAPMTGALAKVQALKPCTYTWKSDGSAGEGFIAHELQAVVPDCVSGEKDAVDEEGNIKPQGIDTSFLVATLTAAIQELNAKVDAQAAEIQALKGTA